MISELGIDEAGRGPILGPLVMAGVVIPEKANTLLSAWGVTDSKKFGSSKNGQSRRREIAEKIKRTFEHRVIVLSSRQVDDYVCERKLNILEQITARTIIAELKADRVVLDGEKLFSVLSAGNVIAVDKADQKYLSVAAASVLAKAERDRLFEELCIEFKHTFGEVRGGGYANKKTMEFVQWYRTVYNDLPAFYRKSYRWKLIDE